MSIVLQTKLALPFVQDEAELHRFQYVSSSDDLTLFWHSLDMAQDDNKVHYQQNLPKPGQSYGCPNQSKTITYSPVYSFSKTALSYADRKALTMNINY